MFSRRRGRQGLSRLPGFKKNIISQIIASPLFLTAVGTLILAGISYPLILNLKQQGRINNEVEELKREIEELEGKNLNLNDLITYLESEQFTEEQARLNFNLKKEGEKVVVINNKDDSKGNIAPSKTQSIYNINKADKNKIKPVSNPYKWWQYFFNN